MPFLSSCNAFPQINTEHVGSHLREGENARRVYMVSSTPRLTVEWLTKMRKIIPSELKIQTWGTFWNALT